MGRLLHVGCGSKRKAQTTSAFNTPAWDELRLDIDPAVSPDIIGTMTDMSGVDDGSVDAIFSSHNVEHLYPHEVPIAFGEFKRVLSDEGFVVITCPDLQEIAALIAADKLLDVAYQSPAGPITPLDVVYGHRGSTASGNHFMAHRCGFTQRVLAGSLAHSGFASVASARRTAPFFDLWALATKRERSEADLRELARLHFPPM